MVDIITAILAVGLPLALVAFLAWAEFNFKWKRVLVYFLLFGAPALLIALYNPFANLKDWQLGLFGVVFALALVGVNHLAKRDG